MPDSCCVNLAKILLEHSTTVKPKDKVMIIAYPTAEPLVIELYKQLLALGAYPHTHIEIEELDYLRFTRASDDQLKLVNPIVDMVAETFDVYIEVLSKSNTRDLTNADPERQAVHARAYAAIARVMRKRAASGLLRWVLTAFPTYAYAQEAQMSLTEYEDFVFRTTYANLGEPLEKWKEIQKNQQRYVDWMHGKKLVEVRGSNIDLHFSIEGRPFVNEAGFFNLPDGEVFTAPIEDSMSGWARFTYPSVFHDRVIEAVEITFEQGYAIEAHSRQNDEVLQHILNIDEGARYVGEFGIGLNSEIDRCIRNPLFDEKMDGTVHIGLGAGFPESGSKNDSAIHLDLICEMRDGGEILVDGDCVYQDGAFTIL